MWSSLTFRIFLCCDEVKIKIEFGAPGGGEKQVCS